MSDNIIYSGDQIKTFIPQREPILMVDKLFFADEASVETGLTVKDNNIFCDNGLFCDCGIIEHIAQSAAVFAGYDDWINHRPVVLGYIAEIKNFVNSIDVHAGDSLKSQLKVVSKVMNITLMSAQTTLNDTLVASCKIKIFMDKK